MDLNQLGSWRHDHSFGQDKKRPGELRTLIVIAITVITMVVEIAAGFAFGSMALLADGLHMASHVAALTISAAAYVYARKHAHDRRYSFGTGKVNVLGGFTGAVLLAVFALVMVCESVSRLINPVAIAFDQAIFVAFLGLIVNGISVFILDHSDHKDSEEDRKEHGHETHAGHHHDHNLRAAYLHVLADTLTSVLAIFALLAGRYLGQVWLDPVMGVVGAIVVAKWSFGLVRTTGLVLLDRQGPEHLQNAIRECIEQHDDNQVTDLHLWSIGPGLYALELAIITSDPKSPGFYKTLLPSIAGLVHVTTEVHRRTEVPDETPTEEELL